MRKKLLLVSLFILGLTSCSTSEGISSIPSSSQDSSIVEPSLPTSDPNDIGGDNLQSSWNW